MSLPSGTNEDRAAVAPPPCTTARKQIRVSGIVQEVGFRPFVYHLAHTLDVKGYVLNTSEGVLIEVEGHDPVLARFLHRLTNEPLSLAHIENVSVSELEPVGHESFVIRDSVGRSSSMTLVSPRRRHLRRVLA